MIKLVCYGSKTLCLKEAYCSYVGENKFTTVQIITADEIDGHKVDEFNVELHIIRGVYDDKHPLTFIKNGTTLSTEYALDSRYTSYARELGFYLKFTKKTETGEEIVGLTNAVYLHTVENKKLEEPKDDIDYDNSNSNGSFNGGSNSGSGKDGKDGKNGITYTPSISEDGILSWTNDGGLPNPTPIKVIGKDGTNGTDGVDGKDGVGGKSAYQIAVDNGFEGSQEEWLESLKGHDGANGENGKDGQDYALTEEDKQEIAQIAVNLIPTTEGVKY